MPRTTKLEDHLTVKELKTRYRDAEDPAERAHTQIVWLLAPGEQPKEGG